MYFNKKYLLISNI